MSKSNKQACSIENPVAVKIICDAIGDEKLKVYYRHKS